MNDAIKNSKFLGV